MGEQAWAAWVSRHEQHGWVGLSRPVCRPSGASATQAGHNRRLGKPMNHLIGNCSMWLRDLQQDVKIYGPKPTVHYARNFNYKSIQMKVTNQNPTTCLNQFHKLATPAKSLVMAVYLGCPAKETGSSTLSLGCAKRCKTRTVSSLSQHRISRESRCHVIDVEWDEGLPKWGTKELKLIKKWHKNNLFSMSNTLTILWWIICTSYITSFN